MNTATRKAKGKRLQKYVCNLILKAFPILSEQDVVSIRMGRPGEDVHFLTKLKNYFLIQLNAKIRKE